MSKTVTKYGFPNGARGMRMVDRFWEKVRKSDSCWEWIGSISKDGGYGVFHVSSERPTVKSHRVSWEIANGCIPEGMLVCHRCDNPKCVRPDHLFLGNYLVNNRDMVQKERHGRMIFTADKVRRLRAFHEKHPNHFSHQWIADFLGVAKPTITAILTRRNWKHV